MRMLRVSSPDLAALVDPEGDLAEVHVLQRAVDGSACCLRRR
jgi:hypothetical protein